MLSKLRTFVIVSALAVALWLFAEGESLGEFSGLTSVRFVSNLEQGRLIIASESFEGTVSVKLLGSRAAIARAEGVLARGVRLEPGMPGVPATEGTFAVNISQALEFYPDLASTGVRLSDVTPQTVEVEVTELVTLEVEIEPLLGELEVVGAVRTNPERARLRLARSAVASLGPDPKISARVAAEQLREIAPGVPARVEARLEVPAGLPSSARAEVLPATAFLEFLVRTASATEVFRSVPVQVLLPPIEVGDWSIEINESDRFLSTEVTGAPEQIERLRTKADALIALLPLSSDDLLAGVNSKKPSFVLLRDGSVVSRSSVRIAEPTDAVRFKVTRTPPKESP